MKKILILILSLIFIGCEKKEVAPTTSSVVVTNTIENPIGVTWELYSGRVFVKNITLLDNYYYDHFGPNKNSSNLDVFSPSWLPIDIITKGITTWKFTSSGQFILDGISIYDCNLYNSTFSVYGLENGSARPITILSNNNDYMVVKIYESNGNNGTYNFSFYTYLTFRRAGYTGNIYDYDVPQSYTYGGVWGYNGQNQTTLQGTKWVVTKYIQNFNSAYPNDTLDFFSNSQYTINNGAARNYNLSSIVGNNMRSLSLYSFTTLGGDWSGQVQSTFINDWVINNSLFTNILSTNNYDTRIWMKRIQ